MFPSDRGALDLVLLSTASYGQEGWKESHGRLVYSTMHTETRSSRFYTQFKSRASANVV